MLSNKNRLLLDVISSTHPESLQDLAASTGRKTSNLSRMLRTMERYGFVELHRGVRGRIRPEVPYSVHRPGDGAGPVTASDRRVVIVH